MQTMEPKITLRDGKKIPALGFGLWQLKEDTGKKAIEHAINVGYRNFDGAWIYQNEDITGEVFAKCFKDGKLKREDIFMTSKLWNCFHRPDQVEIGLQESLRKLKFSYIDMYLIHWPIAYKPGNVNLDESMVPEGFDDVDIADTWKAMEKLVDSGKVKYIGVSNFNERQIRYILKNSRIKPAVLQIELHLYLPNTELVKLCTDNKICVTAYSPLGSPGRPWADIAKDGKGPLEDPHVNELVKKCGVSPAQLLLSHLIRHRGVAAIPKSINAVRISENFQAQFIKLEEEDMKLLDGIKIRRRFVAPDINKTHKEYPFDK